ncbi:ATP-dependent RNA helicase DDX51 isoform X2 [Bombina bombina]|uniref:ATP-dependent RNA helicase DDX51 isoform X2 n=1 Tax=Bombina bombina TaxID=8345 RepID=UPI00235ABF67|nr:ATP-dependent RNA helicase DDX51 isoform X2 [Bombina bombina]
MSLFVINRYLGDEAESSEDRSRALLEKLREQAKTRQLEKQESEKYKPTHGTDKKDFPIPSDEEVEKEKQKKSKKRKKKQNKEQREEVESSSSECEQKGESFPSAGKKKKKTNKLEEEQEGNNEDTTKSDNSREDNGCGEEKVDPDSIILGGFESKSIQKVMPVLPQWLAKPNLVHKDIKQNLVPIQDVPGLHPKILKKLEANKVKSFFPVQAEVIPAILESTCHGFLLGRGGYRPSDMCVSAPTGSGKTLAFVIPIVQALLHRVICEVRVLVVLPTKELAQQVCKVFNTYVDGTGLKVVMLTGQKSFPKEQETLVQRTASGFCSLADILVSTPGRLVDHIQETEGFSLRHLRFLVIDEADRMIDSMNQDWLHHVTKAVFQVNDSAPNILFSRKEPGTLTAASSYLPQIPLQKLLFSATLTQNPEKLQKLGLYQPRLFTSTHKGTPIDSADSHSNTNNLAIYSLPEGLTHYYVPCNLNSKPLILLYFLLILRFTRVLCFTNSREASHRLFLLFRSFGGISVAEFSSRLSPGERKKTLKEFEQGKLQILISTDATARGIDIKGVKCVINYDAPQFIRTYIHRVGRTARAGNVGSAFTMLLQVQLTRSLRMRYPGAC